MDEQRSAAISDSANISTSTINPPEAEVRGAIAPSRRSAGFHFVRIALGILLLVAACLKAVALWNGQTAGPLLSSPRWQIATIEVETLLGLWLLSGFYARGAWWSAVPLFTALSGFTLYLALDGQQSCKCFGAVNVSPWVTFTMDMSAVMALLVWRPAGPESHTRLASGALQTAFGAFACLDERRVPACVRQPCACLGAVAW